MKIQVRSLAIALAIAIAVAATANSSAVPINGTLIKAAVPAVTTDVRNRVRQAYPTYNSYRGYPAYSSYWGYATYNSYWSYPTHHYPGISYGWR
jgi:hypothetical protein